jgi:hypothetical protein
MTSSRKPVARRSSVAGALLVAAALLAAPAAPALAQGAQSLSPAAAAALGCGACGKVVSIQRSESKQSWTPLGTGIGVGGAPAVGETPNAVTTFRIGPGLTNQGIVVLGAAGGADYRRTPQSYEQRRWDVVVKLDSGGVRIVSLSYEPYVREGDRVRISGNNVELLDE